MVEDKVKNFDTIEQTDSIKEIFLKLELDYVFHTQKKVDEIVKAFIAFAKEHDEGSTKRKFTQETFALYKRSRD